MDCLPSELITMILEQLDDIVDLQDLMLASPQVWRDQEHNRCLY